MPSGERTWSVPACCARHPQASSGLPACHWRDNGGTLPRPGGRDGAPVRKRRAPSRRLPPADAFDGIALQHLGEDADAARVGGHEHAQLPGDDLVEEAVDLEPLPHRIGETGQLDAVRAHDANAAKLQALREIEDGAAFHQGGEGALCGERLRFGAERDCGPSGRDLAADDALARIGLKAVDARRLVRKALPDRQERSRNYVKRALGELGNIGEFSLPGSAKSLAIRLHPMAFRYRPQRNAAGLHRPNEPYAPLNLSVVEHHARCRDLEDRTARALVDKQHGAWIEEAIQDVVQTEGPIALTLCDAEQPGFRAGAGMGVNRAPLGDDKTLGPERLQPGVVGP